MKAEYINPFIDAARKVMEIMVGIKKFERKDISLGNDLTTKFDISALIGVTGQCTGSIILSFDGKIAASMLSSLLGEQIDQLDDNVCDVVGEMVNIIVGNAITDLSNSGLGKIERSIPNVILGNGHVIKIPRNIPCMSIVFDTELGGFSMQVSMKCR